MVKSIYSSQKDTPKEYDANNSFLSNSMDNSLNNINKNSNKFKKNEEIMIIESNANYFGELNTEHNNYNNLITKKSKNIKDNKMSGNSRANYNFFINNNNNIYRNHLHTVLETLNEVSNSIVESSAINKNSQIDLNNVDDAKEVNDVGEKKIFNNEQKYQFSENRINYTDNNIGSNIPTTSVVHNTKKSIYVTKSEKAD
jgi:hypothetical protein